MESTMESSKEPLVVMQHFVLGTAGHIDHGKSALVEALTGTDPDRLKEEKKRGITIELGFAHLDFDDLLVHIVDVPGHERFIRAMAAGAAGIDAVMLAVAADEGIMPQTREHLEICKLLGVERGLVALTKADLVEEDWLEMVREDLAGFLAGSFLEDAPVIPCSAVTGQGLDELRADLEGLAARVRMRTGQGLARLPIDRVFTMKGFGTVVTGTLVSGRLALGQDLEIQPSGHRASVRGIQVHGRSREDVDAGNRVAVNLKGVERQDVARGEVLTEPGRILPTMRFDAMVDWLEWNRRPLKRHKPVIVLAGTTQAEGRMIPLASDSLDPGTRGPVQIALSVPLVLLPGDRFILQGFEFNPQHGATVGGGLVVRPHPPRRRRADPEYAAFVEALEKAEPLVRTEMEIRSHRARGALREQLLVALPLVPEELDEVTGKLVADGVVVDVSGRGGHFVHAEALDEVQTHIMETMASLAAERPMESGFDPQEVQAGLAHHVEKAVFDEAVRRLVSVGKLMVDQEHLATAEMVKAGRRAETEKEVEDFFRQAGLAPPKVKDAAARLDMPERELRTVIRSLVRSGRLVATRDDLHFCGDLVEDLRKRLVAFLEEHGEITPGQFKEMCGQTRRYVIPLAEYFDSQKLTIRVGDVRKLRGR